LRRLSHQVKIRCNLPLVLIAKRPKVLLGARGGSFDESIAQFGRRQGFGRVSPKRPERHRFASEGMLCLNPTPFVIQSGGVFSGSACPRGADSPTSQHAWESMTSVD